ncbi:MAG: SMI1/KNR4 family protein, partial [Isosphaeraceae bacterium]
MRTLLAEWAARRGFSAEFAPGVDAFLDAPDGSRPPARLSDVVAWEERYGYALPPGLRDWLLLSNGLYSQGAPWIHPLSGIGPMVQFARMPGLVVQPESWFELGNPNVETVCIDLSYSWPGGGPPIFTSGDDLSGSAPRLIAQSFDEWLLGLIRQGGREYWFDPSFRSLGHPWSEHRRRSPAPPLPSRLRPHAGRAL